MKDRSPTRIMMTVWKALFLREAGVRLFKSRAAWVWVLLEPLVHVVFIALLFSMIRQREISGIDIVVFLVTGLYAFFLFRTSATQMGGAIDSNRALFTYRQVTPFDPIMIRGLLEAAILISAFIATLLGMALLEYHAVPDDALRMLYGFAGVWLFGTGLGLVVAIAGEVVSEMRKIFLLLTLPLYFISAVIWPISMVPPQYRDIILLNPIVHGIETVRMGFSENYISIPGIDMTYLLVWAALSWALGLVLYRNFSYRIVAE